MNSLPTRKELMNAILAVFYNSEKKVLSTKEINEAVIVLLNIPQDLLLIEDSNCSGTEYSYKMRWARTALKQQNKITNPNKGEWILINQQ